VDYAAFKAYIYAVNPLLETIVLIARFRNAIDVLTGRRSLDAAATGRRWPSGTRLSNLNTDVLAGGRTIRERAAYYVRNNAHASAAVTGLVTNIVGPGIVPSPQHPDPDERQRLSDLWSRWTDEADFDSVGDIYALQAMAVRSMVTDGEAFAHLMTAPDMADGLPPLQVRLLHPSQIPTEWPLSLVNNAVRGGIVHDEFGRRVGYLALPFRPDDPMMGLTTAGFNPVHLPACDVCHLFEALEPGQIRGLIWLTPVLLALHELDQLQDAALVRAKLSNLICAAIVDPDGTGGGLSGMQDGGTLDVGLEPGSILPLQPGRNIEFFDPKESANYPAFVQSHLRAIAAGIGIPYEMLTGDLSTVNYSSIRAGLVEFRKKLEHWQHNIVVFKLCRPIWDRWVRLAALSGAIDPNRYFADSASYHAVEWLPPRQEWVDPAKDIEGETGAIAAGLMSRTQALARRGVDITRVRREIAAERAADAAAGLTFATAPMVGGQENLADA